MVVAETLANDVITSRQQPVNVIKRPVAVTIDDFTLAGIQTANSHFVRDYPSISTENTFIPVQALSDGEILSLNGVSVLFYEFFFPSRLNRNVLHCRTFDLFIEKLKGQQDILRNGYKHGLLTYKNSQGLGIQGTYGMMYRNTETSRIEILMTLCVKKQFVLDNNNRLDPSKYVLVVDKKLFSEEFSSLFKGVIRPYTSYMLNNGVDVFYGDLMSNCYNGIIDIPRFGSMQEMLDYASKVNLQIMR